MSKKQKKTITFNEILKQTEPKQNLSEKEPNITIINDNKIELSQDEYTLRQEEQQRLNNKNLALSFKYLTNNKDYNFNYFRKNKSEFETFTTHLNSVLMKITSLTMKDLNHPMFKDRFPFNKLYPGVYDNSLKVFENTEELISVELGSKSSGRMILFYDGNAETGDNILYVLLFQNNFNKPAYSHGDKRKR